MDFLALCQRARLECGISGDGPAAVTGQTGQLERLITWVVQGWTDLQMLRPNWDFMWSQFEFDTVATTRDYTPADVSITNLEYWDLESFLIYEKALGESDENELEYLQYKFWRERYRRQMGVRDDDRPILITLLPDDKVRFEPRPDKIYTVSGDYKRSVQTLAANGDEPLGLPERFHLMIVFKAMESYGLFEDAPEIKERAEEQLNIWMPLLEDYGLPEVTIQAEPIGGEGDSTGNPGNFTFR